MAKLLWTQKQDVGPKVRFRHAMVFDLVAQRVLLFGGNPLDGKLLRDTWQWDGQDWTQLEDIGPAARSDHAMAYDATRNRTVLFGGNNGTKDFGDTWEWDGSGWTQIQDVGPPPRTGHAMVFDAARGHVVLFGGGPPGTPLSDTWVWDGSDWSQVEDTGPSARRLHAMTYDRARSRVVLFGGVGSGATDGLADTWEWNGTLWKQVADIGPGPCLGAALVFRTAVSELFGGMNTLANSVARELLDLTWEWDGAHWTERQDIGVGPRHGHAMVFDEVRSRVVLFGGLSVPPDNPGASAGLMGDTWEHADVLSGGGPGGVVPLEAVAAPSLVHPGGLLSVVVTLQALAAGAGEQVEVTSNIGDLGTATVAPGATSGLLQVQIPPTIGNNVPLPFQLEITATAGGVSRSASVIISD